MLYDVDAVLLPVRISDPIDANAKDPSLEDGTRRQQAGRFDHAAQSWRNPRAAPRNSTCVQQRSSVLAEVGWLTYFFAVFAAAVYFMVGVVVPHHFNDKVAIALAAMFAGLVMILTRAWRSRRARDGVR